MKVSLLFAAGSFLRLYTVILGTDTAAAKKCRQVFCTYLLGSEAPPFFGTESKRSQVINAPALFAHLILLEVWGFFLIE